MDAKHQIHLKKSSKAYDALWDGIILVQGLEFDLFPEQKQSIMPLRLALEDLSTPLYNLIRNNLRPDKHISFEFYDKWNPRFSKVMKEFSTVLTHSSGEKK